MGIFFLLNVTRLSLLVCLCPCLCLCLSVSVSQVDLRGRCLSGSLCIVKVGGTMFLVQRLWESFTQRTPRPGKRTRVDACLDDDQAAQAAQALEPTGDGQKTPLRRVRGKLGSVGGEAACFGTSFIATRDEHARG